MKNKKSLGQHWLKNRAILNQIADYAAGHASNNISNETNIPSASQSSAKKDCVLEIGPGLGTLTSSLLKRFNQVIAVEYDENLANNLPKSFPGTNLTVVHSDFLKFDLNQLPKHYVVAGNIPYYITSPIVEKLLTTPNQPSKIVLLIQKEVAERILSPKESLLSLMVKNRATPHAGIIVSRTEFTPPPKVDSQVIILDLHTPQIPDEVFSLIKLGFSSPRKKLLHNLISLKSTQELKNIFIELDINPDARPADLHLNDWHNLFNML